MRSALIVAGLCLTAIFASATPRVDGTVTPGEYAHTLSVIYDTATVSWSADSSAGLYVAVSAPTQGWVGIGLGAVVMDGAHIFMGYVKDGQSVISEQVGLGHTHDASPVTWAEASAVSQQAGMTTLEVHVPGSRVPVQDGKVSFIVAFAGKADTATFHEDNHDGGYIDLGVGK